ncbi:MAG: NUDIX domain-containing protein [Bacilli bacterium]|nr:NUDIX domain-containing protein [Bacilli bacterium]
MEYLDVYTEDGKYLGKEERSIVHRDALWHNTVHCWLYDKDGHIYFQIRKDKKKFYTTASGHVLSGESIPLGFAREIKEEIGIDISIDRCKRVDVVKFTLDREERDGSFFRDRAFANVYICDFEESIESFHFDLNEIDGLVKMHAVDVLKLIYDEVDFICSTYIVFDGQKNISYERKVTKEDFLVNKGETIIEKYGRIVKEIIEITS